MLANNMMLTNFISYGIVKCYANMYKPTVEGLISHHNYFARIF